MQTMFKVKTFNDNIHNEASPICSAPSALTSWNMMLRDRTFLSSLFVTANGCLRHNCLVSESSVSSPYLHGSNSKDLVEEGLEYIGKLFDQPMPLPTHWNWIQLFKSWTKPSFPFFWFQTTSMIQVNLLKEKIRFVDIIQGKPYLPFSVSWKI